MLTTLNRNYGARPVTDSQIWRRVRWRFRTMHFSLETACGVGRACSCGVESRFRLIGLRRFERLAPDIEA